MSIQERNRGQLWVGAAVLAGITGALLTLGCDENVAAGEVTAANSLAIEHDVADLEQQVAEAERGAQREIEQARENSENMPVASREQLEDAIERTEEARDEANDRLDELKHSGGAHWDARRARVVEALGELENARHDVVAALGGGEPSLSDS